MSYATVDELQILLRLEAPTELQLEEMQRALDEAAEEIDWELGYTAEAPAPTPPPALVVGVNLDRAVEHWRQAYGKGFGLMTAGDEAVFAGSNSWQRHYLKLLPLKAHQGIA